MAQIILVRHGETAMNSSLRYWGSTDVALGEEGKKQAQKLCRRLEKIPVNVAYSSPLSRAYDTAVSIVEERGVTVKIHPELSEFDFGRIEGLTFEEVKEHHPEIARMWIERSTELRYPGGECLQDFIARVQGFTEMLRRQPDDDTVLVVAHAGVLRVLICDLLSIDIRHWWQMRVDLASVSVVTTWTEGGILTLLNDTSHLRDGLL